MFTNNEQDQGPVECRICHSKTTRDLILSPCLCKGSMGFVHTRCLEQWLNVSSHNFCELCSHRFEVIQVRRYSLLRSIRVWVCKDQGSLCKAVFFIVISAANSVLLSWMWMLWLSHITLAFSEVQEEESDQGESSDQLERKVTRTKWIAVFIFLTLLTIFSIKSLCFDGYRAIKAQYHKWHRWWNETVNVQLVVDSEKYKIKNKLEESKDISLNYAQGKTSNLNESTITSVNNGVFHDKTNYSNTLLQDIAEIHSSGKKPAVIISTTELFPDAELDKIIIEPETIHDKHENNLQEKGNASNESMFSKSSADVPDENVNQNINFKDIPHIHKQYTNKQE